MTIRQAMILAAGLGTRLRPITDTTPKPLVKIGGRAMIDYALDALADAGVTHAVVNVHHHADQMEAHLSRFDRMQITISDERDGLLNSGGGLKQGLRFLRREPLYVMNADLFWVGEPPGQASNLSRLADFFDPERMDIAMLCVDPQRMTGHNGKMDFSIGSRGNLQRFRDGMSDPVVYAGALILPHQLLDDAPADAFNLNIYFDKAIAAGRLYGQRLTGHWITVGTPEAIGEAEEVLADFAMVEK
ncbi:nucleotidyltransferase family protein [Peteryoungia desertarenae]|uniref:Nucleotidyltransferase family protein n=1 Tax=Peteryoungia desertarenae TaxID=1813451 RepID=A0ABX6QKX8_9HYPH|nr:nucleotidyltransferase family protein [Peteryoungia desertarenae]QLF68880.1 nucleotidyltransferase family protein [Peteryoungia desertarenae]